MTPTETRELLSEILAYDRRIRPPDTATAANMAAIWARGLADVPLVFAQETLDQWYARPGDNRLIGVGDLREAWRRQQARVQQAAEDEARRSQEETIEGIVYAAPTWARAYLAACAEARTAGLPYPDPPHQTAAAGITDAERMRRRCRHHDICACSHEDCRKGWLDDEVPWLSRLTGKGSAVRRCPTCQDATKMVGSIPGRARR
jgi:hypothetical protein